MATVLGIDAAWTVTQPSGVALVAKRQAAWQPVALSPSYQDFHARAADTFGQNYTPDSFRPDATALLASAQMLCGHRVSLVAIDMPLARQPIVGRRPSDDAVSRAYGARKCGTHSPSVMRPGPISDELRAGFAKVGYPLRTTTISSPGLIEVYPHPALAQLAHASERLPYKVSKASSYWPKSPTAERRILVLQDWARIVGLLDAKIEGVEGALRPPANAARGLELKSYEGMLDAVVCCWVGICALEGRANPFGDHESAIWIPNL